MREMFSDMPFMYGIVAVVVGVALSLASVVVVGLWVTSAQVVETSVTTTDNSPSQDYTHPDDQTTLQQSFN